MQEWLRQNCQEEGWLLSEYLGSQGSVTRKDGKQFLNYRVKRFEPATTGDSGGGTEDGA